MRIIVSMQNTLILGILYVIIKQKIIEIDVFNFVYWKLIASEYGLKANKNTKNRNHQFRYNK